MHRRSALIAGLTLVLALQLFFLIASDGKSLVGPGGRAGVVTHLLALAAVMLWNRRARPTSYWADGRRLLLALLLLVNVYDFYRNPGKRMGDGFFYYAYVESIWKDFDVRMDDEQD